MVYQNFEEWKAANTAETHRMLQKKSLSAEESCVIDGTIHWLENKIEDNVKYIRWMQDAIKEVCSADEQKMINNFINAYKNVDAATRFSDDTEYRIIP